MLLRPVNSSDDIHTMTELILGTDPYIYIDLFGSVKNAERVLGVLFSSGKGIFKKDCYYVAEHEGDIIGIAALFLPDDIWNEEEVKMAFLEAEVEIPDSFFAASEYFQSVHNYRPGTKACNVCVLEKFRNHGFGNEIIKQLLLIAGNFNVTLTVLAENEIAIKLYEKNGFRVMYDFMDYGGYKKPKVRCYCMIRMARKY